MCNGDEVEGITECGGGGALPTGGCGGGTGCTRRGAVKEAPPSESGGGVSGGWLFSFEGAGADGSGGCVWKSVNSLLFRAIHSRGFIFCPELSCTTGATSALCRSLYRLRNFFGSLKRNSFPLFLRSFATPAIVVAAIHASARTGRSAAASSSTCTHFAPNRCAHRAEATATCAALAPSSLKWNPKNESPFVSSRSRFHHSAPSCVTSGIASRITAHRSTASERNTLCLAKNRAVRNCAKMPRLVAFRRFIASFPSVGASFSLSTSLLAATFTASANEYESPWLALAASFFNRFMLCRNHGSSKRLRNTARSSSRDCETRCNLTLAARTSLPCAGVSCFCRLAWRLAYRWYCRCSGTIHRAQGSFAPWPLDSAFSSLITKSVYSISPPSLPEKSRPESCFDVPEF